MSQEGRGQRAFLRRLFEFEGAGIQLIVLALLGDQLVVAAALDDAAVLKDDDDIGVLDRGEPVGDDEDRPPAHQRVHTLLDNGDVYKRQIARRCMEE